MKATKDCVLAGVVGVSAAVMCLASASAQEPNQSNQYDSVVDAFIAYDIGQLKGQAGQEAYRCFTALTGDEAIMALVRGVNKAARIQNSCPIVVICSKLRSVLAKSQDEKLLRAAFSALNANGDNVYYAAYVGGMRQAIDQRLAQISGEKPRVSRTIRGGGTAGQLRRSRKPVEQWSLEDLQGAISEDKDVELLRVLEELKNRKGGAYTAALAAAIPKVEESMRPIARGLLAHRLARMTDSTLRIKFRDANAEIRAAAARAIGYKRSELYAELAVAVRDKDAEVAKHAHAVLVKLTGQDFGPSQDASALDCVLASKAWEKWARERSQQSSASR